MKRLPFIDALKALASQLIVLHHLAFYGLMSDYARSLAPETMSWFYSNARIAVQVFLVVGGFLAAQSLTRNGIFGDKPLPALLWRRYLKLVRPYLVALLLAMLAAAIARRLMDHPATPGVPEIAQIIAHCFLLQGVLGFDGLSAGVWYVAIDFQLYALLAGILWLAQRIRPGSATLAVWLVLLLVIASLFYFNRDSRLDNWAIYFFGAYGLGALTCWSTRRGATSRWLLLVFVLVIAALLLDYRVRLAVALTVAVALALSRHTGLIERWPQSAVIGWLGQISYSVFLVHYPICLVVSALFEHFALHSPEIQAVGMLAAWAASLAGGALFYRWVECRGEKGEGGRGKGGR